MCRLCSVKCLVYRHVQNRWFYERTIPSVGILVWESQDVDVGKADTEIMRSDPLGYRWAVRDSVAWSGLGSQRSIWGLLCPHRESFSLSVWGEGCAAKCFSHPIWWFGDMTEVRIRNWLWFSYSVSVCSAFPGTKVFQRVGQRLVMVSEPWHWVSSERTWRHCGIAGLSHNSCVLNLERGGKWAGVNIIK